MIKKIIKTAIFIFFITGNLNAQNFSDCYKYYVAKDYFRLKTNFEKTVLKEKWENDLLKGLVLSIFGRHSEANLIFTGILEYHKESVPDSLLAELYKHKAVNHAGLYEYKNALSASTILRDKYYRFLDEEEKEDLPDEIALWDALKNEPKQKTHLTGGMTVQMKKDIAGLWNIPVTIGDTTLDFVFDTGANVSVLTESTALKLGIKVTGSGIKVGTATDIKVDSKAGICADMQIGKIVINNVALLILPDETLTFGPFYKITGIIGIPVIKALNEITINKDNLLTVSSTSENNKYSNFCFEGYTPVIQMIHNSDSLSFIFDSGAMSTMLFKPYFDLYKSNIENNYELTEITVGGAGGNKKVKGYKLNGIILASGNIKAELDKISLLIENIKKRNSYFFGNIGQDFIMQSREVIINYGRMFIDFR
jgi:clan AA aspartic protease (TIGR02281 family)